MGLGRGIGGPHPRSGSITCVQCLAGPAPCLPPEEGDLPARGREPALRLLGELRPGGGAGSQPELGGDALAHAPPRALRGLAPRQSQPELQSRVRAWRVLGRGRRIQNPVAHRRGDCLLADSLLRWRKRVGSQGSPRAQGRGCAFQEMGVGRGTR